MSEGGKEEEAFLSLQGGPSDGLSGCCTSHRPKSLPGSSLAFVAVSFCLHLKTKIRPNGQCQMISASPAANGQKRKYSEVAMSGRSTLLTFGDALARTKMVAGHASGPGICPCSLAARRSQVNGAAIHRTP